MPCIYKVTNLVNGKVYIGQTAKTAEARFKEHLFCGTHKEYAKSGRLYAAMRKYGCDKFAVETIEECSKESLNEREIYWISQYDSFKRGYNGTFGGYGGKTIDADKAIALWKAGLSMNCISKEMGASRSSIAANLYASGITEEEISERTLEIHKRKHPYPVYQYNADGSFVAEYASLEEVCKAFDVSPFSVRAVIRGATPLLCGYQWKREKADHISGVETRGGAQKRTLYQYALDGTYIRSFRTVREAKDALQLEKASVIKQAIHGTAKTAYGYLWSYDKRQNYYESENAIC